ncbi:hypothetical protein TSAR_008343 [Trichomalopsis sarcophagae]|uniref:Uncharacterized protein n=1 Tax=Trichomalopsis sarcophagae TaxID=543379 RepID=A0A232F3H3_9HYME|nr:hypothetical protein TSAR_008343 [Trichomalopsis sarcophagae]
MLTNIRNCKTDKFKQKNKDLLARLDLKHTVEKQRTVSPFLCIIVNLISVHALVSLCPMPIIKRGMNVVRLIQECSQKAAQLFTMVLLIIIISFTFL